MMSMVVLGITIAAAIAVGTVGSYILTMKLMTTRRGKKAVIDYSKELTDLTYQCLKENIKTTQKWQDLVMGADE